jgi:hypothetical protein
VQMNNMNKVDDQFIAVLFIFSKMSFKLNNLQGLEHICSGGGMSRRNVQSIIFINLGWWESV